MGKPDTRRLDREIQQTNRKLEAVRNRELWPLDGRERRAVLGALATGSYRVVRGNSPARAERKLDTAWQSVETRLVGNRRPAGRAATNRDRGRHRQGREEAVALVVSRPRATNSP